MTKYLRYALIALAISAGTTACSPWLTPTPEVIQEDDPRWDCHTMGNRICGPGHG